MHTIKVDNTPPTASISFIGNTLLQDSYSLGSSLDLFSNSTENIILRYGYTFKTVHDYFYKSEPSFDKKASQAYRAYGDRQVSINDILFVYDATLLQVGGRGFFITEDAIYYRSSYGISKVEGKLIFEDLGLT